MAKNHLQCLVLGSILAVAALPAAGQPGHPSSATPLRRALTHSLTLRWEEVPLRDALGRLASTQSVPLHLDRRVDPNQRVTLSLERVSVREALAALTQSTKLGFCEFSTLVYVGPVDAASELRTLVTHSRGR